MLPAIAATDKFLTGKSGNLKRFFSAIPAPEILQQYLEHHVRQFAGDRIHMLLPGPAKKVTIHLNEDTAAKHDFLYNEIFAFLLTKGVAGASLLRPDAGFGSHHRVHQAEYGPGEDDHMPVRIEFIESPDKVAALMPELCNLLSDGLIEAHDTTVYKATATKEHPL